MADTAAALVIQLSADLRDFKKQMEQATGVFDTEGRKIAKKQADLRKTLSNWSLDFTGLTGLNKALVGLTAVGAATGLAALVKSALDAATAIGDIAQQGGVSVEFLQKMRFAASQSGASFDVMDEALSTLNKTFGEFVNTGAGKGAQTFKTLGIDKLINAGDIRNTEELFDSLVRKISAFGSEAQKSAFLASTFGKEAGPKLLQLVNQGIDGIAKLEAQAVSLGIVLSTETVEGATKAKNQLDALFNVMKAQGVAAVASLAPEIAHLAQQITAGLPDLITWVERWAAYFGLIELSPVQKLKAEIADVTAQLADNQKLKDSAFLNPLGIMSLNIDAGKAELLSKLAGLQADMAHALGMTKTTHGHHTIFQDGPPLNLPTGRGAPLQINDIAGQKAAAEAAKKAEELRLKRQVFLAQTVVDQKTADAALLAAQDQSNVERLRGSAEYYGAVQKQITDEYNSEVQVIQAKADKQRAELAKQGTDWAGYADAVRNIDDALTADLAVAAVKRAQKLFEVGPEKLLHDALQASKDQVQAYQDETAQLGVNAGALARLQFIQEQENQARRDGITLTNEQTATIHAEADAVGIAAQKADDAKRAMDRNIESTDDFRRDLEDLGVAGVTNFNNIGDAVSSFAQQIAELILRLYVLRPLIEDTFGKSGSPFGFGGGIGEANGGGDFIGTGGGGFFSAISSLFGFAKGGVMTPNGPRSLQRYAGGGTSNRGAIFGEAGPEAAVPLPDGRRIPVDLRMPSASAGQGAGVTIMQQFDLSGAVVTDELYARMNDTAAQHAQTAVAQFNRNVLPARFRTLRVDTRRNY